MTPAPVSGADAGREAALKAIDLAERIAGRYPKPDGQTISLTPYGWEIIYRAFDVARAALHLNTESGRTPVAPDKERGR